MVAVVVAAATEDSSLTLKEGSGSDDPLLKDS
jgi:hypothetical protein